MLRRTTRAAKRLCFGFLFVFACLVGVSPTWAQGDPPAAPTISSIVNDVVGVPALISEAVTVLGGVVATVALAFAGFKLVKIGLRWLGWIKG